MMSAVAKALKLIKDEEVEYLDIRFTDPKGKLQHLTLGVDLVDTAAQGFPSGSQEYLWIDGALRSGGEVFGGFGAFYERLKRDYRKAGSYRWNKAGAVAVDIDRMTPWR